MIPIVIPAMMICLIIGLVLSVVSRFAFHWLGGKLTGYINSEFGGQFGKSQDLFEQFKKFENGGMIPPIN